MSDNLCFLDRRNIDNFLFYCSYGTAKVGSHVRIFANQKIIKPYIEFTYDPAKLGVTNDTDLIILVSHDDEFYNIHENDEFKLDKEKHTLTMPFCGNGTYMLEDKAVWYKIWNIKE